MRVLVAVVMCSCVSTGAVPCGESVCPNGTVCDPIGGVAENGDPHPTCILQEQLDACADPMTIACTIGTAEGSCHQGVCLPVSCGNHRVDPGEVCDDGDTIDDDVCAADCHSDVACGNLVTDKFTNEECDLGDLVSHDGCSSACRVEAATWHAVPSNPQARAFASAAYDARRHTTVMFGGQYEGALGTIVTTELWEWRGGRWRPGPITPPPTSRHAPQLAYDATNHEVLMFGGGGGIRRNDLWSWDGGRWKRLADAPEDRTGHAMAFDAKRGKLVVFGGFTGIGADAGAASAATLEWDAATNVWTSTEFTTTPSGRDSPAMGWDPVRERVVLHGGAVPGVVFQSFTDNETWTFDGTAWTKVNFTSGALQPYVEQARMSWSPALGKLVMYGGADENTQFPDETYAWDGTAWSTIANAPGRTAHALAADDTGELVMFGGIDPQTADELGETLRLDATGWHTVPRPAPRDVANIVNAWDRERIVVYGGRDTNGVPIADTWELGPAGWKSFAGAPPARGDASMVYDLSRGIAVLQGGQLASGTFLDETWAWNGTTWTNLAPATRPPPRTYAAMVYDHAHREILLFGGMGETGDLLDTWKFDGTTWSELHPAHAPTTRISLGYDWGRGEVIGFAAKTAHEETWSWNGSDWIEIPIAGTRPGQRYDGKLVWDAARRHLILTDAFAILDAFEWNGTTRTWTQIATVEEPHRSGGAAVTPLDGKGLEILWGRPGFDLDDGAIRLEWVDNRETHIDDLCELGIDGDGDGKSGCDDPDCALSLACHPSCPLLVKPADSSCIIMP